MHPNAAQTAPFASSPFGPATFALNAASFPSGSRGVRNVTPSQQTVVTATLANFCKDLWFWDNTYFTRTGYKGSLSWSDMMDETLFSIRKPKEQMEKLTGDKIDEWFRAEND